MASSSSSSPQPAAPAVPTLGGAWRAAREALSFSSTRGRRDTGMHLHRIDRYSTVDMMSLPGQRVESAPFRAGGHEWKLVYYPNGDAGTRGGRVASELVLTGGPWWRPFYYPRDVTAAYRVTILDADGNQALASKAVGPHRFSSRWSSAGVKELAKVEELRSALRGGKDDGFVLRCDVTVMNLEKESRIKWYLRQFVKS